MGAMRMSSQFLPRGLSILFPGLAGLGLLLLIGCDQNASAPSGTFRSVYEAIERSNCVECHTATGSAWQQDDVELEFATASAAFIGLTTRNVTGKSSVSSCGTQKLVVPGDVARSYFVAMVDPEVFSGYETLTGCTPYPTHIQDTNLSAAQRASIKQWISRGAPND
jgi:hypothetical protein